MLLSVNSGGSSQLKWYMRLASMTSTVPLCKVYAWANPPPSPKWQVQEIISLIIHIRCTTTFHKPLRHELLRSLPIARIPRKGPYINDGTCPRWYCVSLCVAVSHGEVWHKEWCWCMEGGGFFPPKRMST
uniref:Uncharacterized protein n=1 Tax=Arundo donax TaxID=35708 RepID=A0A0A9TMF4_ARUDO